MEHNAFSQSEEGAKVLNSIKEISDKLQEEKNDDVRTKLMMEMMLRGLALQNVGVPNF